MKPLLILTRIIFVGCFWSIFFLEGIRVIMLRNWRFDIFNNAHWYYAWNKWNEGWVIDDPKEWAFVLIILTFIPLWLTGWAALSMIPWGKIFLNILRFPSRIFRNLFYKPVKIIAKNAGVPVVKKKKSYKEIRPRSTRAPIMDYNEPMRPSVLSNAAKPATQPKPLPIKKEEPVAAATTFEHNLFKFDDDNDDDFDFDFDSFDKKFEEEKTAPQPKEQEQDTPKPAQTQTPNKNKNNNRDKKSPAKNNTSAQNTAPRSGNSTLEVLKQKGYEVITTATIKNSVIDFIGVAEKQIVLCLLDKEPGDWLADEERFNDEEPLWFSESSHRISPVRKVDLARKVLSDKLSEADLNFDIKAYVIVQIGNIINAEDMFETWDDLNISVTRIDRGTPKELKLFSKTIEDAESHIEKDKFEKIKKLVRSIA